MNLRRIDLSYSQHLYETPDLSSARNLEIMVLDGCYSLTKFPKISWSITKLNIGETAIEEVPPAIESLSKLVVLKLDNCRRLKNLPSSIRNLTSLTELELHGCSNITKFPEISGDMKYLSLSETAIEELPSSVECLAELTVLRLQKCKRLNLQVLHRFLDYYSTFDWDNYCISINGPVAISSLPEIVAETGENDGDELLLSQEFLKKCREIYSVPITLETTGHEFAIKHLNVVDPLKDNNNLGRSVSKGNFHRIRCALSYGAQRLGEILHYRVIA